MNESPPRSPWFSVPTIALFQGLTTCFICVLPGIYLKSCGYDNRTVGLVSLLSLPACFRFLFGILVDRSSSTYRWSLLFQMITLIISGFVAATVYGEAPLLWTIGLLGLLSFAGMFLDLSMDGYFLESVSSEEKAFFSSIKVQGFRIGNMIAQGLYVIGAGYLIQKLSSSHKGWGLVFLFHTVLLAGLFIWNLLFFDKTPEKLPIAQLGKVKGEFFHLLKKTILVFLLDPRSRLILLIVLFFRFGEAMLGAMKIPFLIDKREVGGLNLTLEQVGLMNGIIVFICLIVGGLLGGLWVKRQGLKKTLFHAVFLINLPNLGFLYLALFPPAENFLIFGVQPTVQLVLMIEAFCYSLAFAPYIYLIVVASKGESKATIFAFLLSVSTVGWIIPGALSGILQTSVGYPVFLVIVSFIALPTILLIRKIDFSTLVEE